MAEKLMYGEGRSNPGWDGCDTISSSFVEDSIADPTNQKRENSILPKTSVPSPFARFELIQKAFDNYAKLDKDADARDKMLISHALDVLQLFYEGHETKGCKLLGLNVKDVIGRFDGAENSGTRMLGETLRLYREQENMGFGDYENPIMYFLTYKNDPIGCTSPTSIFLATPRYETYLDENITIEGDKTIFKDIRMLCERESDFVEYVYRMSDYINRNASSSAPLESFRKYLVKQKDKIHRSKSELYDKINNIRQTENDLNTLYEKTTVLIYGCNLYYRRNGVMEEKVKVESDFVISSTKSGKKPLVLTNYESSNYNGWRYLSSSQLFNDKSHKINYRDIRHQIANLLPGTDVEYDDGWLCESDFLSDYLVLLPYPLDTKHFFDGNLLRPKKYHYLPPIKKKYFEYFDSDTIYDPKHINDTIGGRKRFEIEEKYKGSQIEMVIVKLRIPVKDGKDVVLCRTYVEGVLDGTVGSKTPDLCVGYFVEVPMMLSIFPFFKLTKNNRYNIQLAFNSLAISGNSIVIEHPDGGTDWNVYDRTKDSQYYSCSKDIDYLNVDVTDGTRHYESVLIPRWPDVSSGSRSFCFAFDFGTSNSHIAIDSADKGKEEFALSKSIVSMIDFSQQIGAEYNEDMPTITTLETIMKQEFLPMSIGDKYPFPLRTVLIQNKSYDIKQETPNALMHLNIPFIYGKEDYNANANLLSANIKWPSKGDTSMAEAFIEELALLARAYVIEHDGDLAKTRIVWTYPLSMKRAMVNKLNDKWREYYQTFFDETYSSQNDSGQVKQLSESVAPLLHYKDRGMDLSSGLLIDIGGGTSDVVIKTIRDGEAQDDIKIASFRFAGDVIFDAGIAKDNPMVQSAYEHFCRKGFLKRDECKSIKTILENACTGEGRSSEANSVLFALEKHPLLASVKKEDKSYNLFLSGDEKRRIIFIYFYSAIIYYLTKLMIDNGYPVGPKGIMFSGTGSKILDVIGDADTLKYLTKGLIQEFSKDQYKYGRSNFEIRTDPEPKKLTADGALHKPRTGDESDIMVRFDETSEVQEATIHYSMAKNADNEVVKMKYKDLVNSDYQAQIVSQIEEFNYALQQASVKLKFVDELGCDKESVTKFFEMLADEDFGDTMKVYITNNYGAEINDSSVCDDEFEDTLFFCPLVAFIQNRLIPNLK